MTGMDKHYNQGLHLPELAKSSSKESIFDFNECPPNHGVTASNGYVVRSLPENSDEGSLSLPCTPEQHSGSETGTSVVRVSNQLLDNDTMELISFLREFIGLSKCRWNQNKALSMMKKRWWKNFLQGTNSMNEPLEKKCEPDKGRGGQVSWSGPEAWRIQLLDEEAKEVVKVL